MYNIHKFESRSREGVNWNFPSSHFPVIAFICSFIPDISCAFSHSYIMKCTAYKYGKEDDGDDDDDDDGDEEEKGRSRRMKTRAKWK